MVILAFMLNFLVMVLLRALYIDLQGTNTLTNSTADRNLTLDKLVSSYFSVWGEDAPKSTAWKSSFPALQNLTKENKEKCSSDENCIDSSINSLDILDDDKTSMPSFGGNIESLFEPPKKKVQPDWKVVLGTFSHYDDHNWREFLIKAEVPIFLRMLVENLSETLTFSREFKIRGKSTESEENRILNPSNYEILYGTSVWLVSHDVKFYLRETLTEYDFFDGQYSESLFFFVSPRLLIQNKVKDNRRVSIIRHFDEKGLNTTLFDRDKIAFARRFYKRID